MAPPSSLPTWLHKVLATPLPALVRSHYLGSYQASLLLGSYKVPSPQLFTLTKSQSRQMKHLLMPCAGQLYTAILLQRPRTHLQGHKHPFPINEPVLRSCSWVCALYPQTHHQPRSCLHPLSQLSFSSSSPAWCKSRPGYPEEERQIWDSWLHRLSGHS